MQFDFDEKFERHDLDEKHRIYSGWLPDELIPSPDQLEQLFALRPDEQQFVRVRGRREPVAIPRRQAAFGADYAFAGIVLHAVATPAILKPYRDWARREVDPRMNGLLLNWYNGPREYIGRHRDEDRDLFEGAPIATMAFGEERKFRMRRKQGNGFSDFAFPHGSFIVIPYTTNLAWEHEVPKSLKYIGRRLSVTVRCFTRGVVEEPEI